MDKKRYECIQCRGQIELMPTKVGELERNPMSASAHGHKVSEDGVKFVGCTYCGQNPALFLEWTGWKIA